MGCLSLEGDSREPPVNLTLEFGTRDEDPRFAPDGKRIVFKQNGELRIMDLSTRQLHAIPFGGAKTERSMPMFTRDGNRILYAEGARKDSDLFSVDIADGTRRPLAIEPELQEYFPCHSTPRASFTSGGRVRPIITIKFGWDRSTANAHAASFQPAGVGNR